MEHFSIVIAGGGPVGLVTAVALARHGIKVLVMEAAPDIPQDLRAGTFHPPTVEMLDSIGLGDALLAKGVKIPKWQMRDRKKGLVAEFDLGMLEDETRFPFRLHCEQHKLSHIAHQALLKLSSATIEFSTSCTGYEQDNDGVTVSFEGPKGAGTVRCDYLVGCDGIRSVVRKTMGTEFEGFTWPERFLVFATPYDMREQGFTGNAYVADPIEWCGIFYQPHDGPPGIWRIAFPVGPELTDEQALADDYVQARIKGFLSPDMDYEISYRSVYRVHQRVANEFRDRRVMLAGDSAHVNNPIGGMGLNSGIQDGITLAEKLVEILLHGASDELLARYARQRRTANVEYVQAQSIRNKRLLEEKDPAVRQERLDEMRAIGKDPAKARAHMLNTSMIASVRRAAEIA